MNSKQVEIVDRYTVGSKELHTHHDFKSRRANLPKSYRPVLDLIPRRIEELKIENPLILDLCVGSGQSADYLEKKKLNVIRADLSWSSLQINGGTRVRCCADELSFGDETLDVIHFKDALVHIEDKSKLFGEIHRVLKPQGVLLLTSAMNSNNSFFQYFSKERGRTIIKEKLFSTLADYCDMVSQMEKSDEITGINPPYFKVSKWEIDYKLRENKLKVINNFMWTKKPWEPDWYDRKVSRIVYFAVKTK